MKINLSKKQYERLLSLVMLGTMVQEAVLESKGEKNVGIRDIEEYLLTYAKDADARHLAKEREDGHAETTPTFLKTIEKIMDEYDEDTFWFELETRLGQRDFELSLTSAQRKTLVSRDGIYPPHIVAFYKKYGQELENYGIERLYINEKAKTKRIDSKRIGQKTKSRKIVKVVLKKKKKK